MKKLMSYVILASLATASLLAAQGTPTGDPVSSRSCDQDSYCTVPSTQTCQR